MAGGPLAQATVKELLKTTAATKTRPVARKSRAQLFLESSLKGLDLKVDRDPDAGGPSRPERLSSRHEPRGGHSSLE